MEETTTSGRWSELPSDLLRSIFERSSFADFRHAKLVCCNWSSVSKLTLPRKSESPWLMLFPKGDDSTCMLYNPEEENRVYTSKRDLSGIRFLANYGNWSLVLDSRSNLYIIDLFSEKTINLPPLESLQPNSNCTIKRLGDKKFESRVVTRDRCTNVFSLNTDVMRGRLWVNEKTRDYVVLWFFDEPINCVCFCRKGDACYTYIPLLFGISCMSQDLYDVVLLGHSLYIQSNHDYIRHLHLSGPEGFKDVSWSNPLAPYTPCQYETGCNITAVTRSGEVLLVQSIVDKTAIGSRPSRSFRVFKKNPSPDPREYYIEVDSLDDEGLILGLRTTVQAGIEPNSIYFTSQDSVCDRGFVNDSKLDICVFNLATKTLKRFPRLENMNLKSARWFLPDTC